MKMKVDLKEVVSGMRMNAFNWAAQIQLPFCLTQTASMLNAGKKNPVAYTTDDTEEGVTQIDLFFTFSIGSIGM